ncbi:sulfatase [Marinilongibacter aquaticus]|uniref:sulfatase n=1 Tax=Marinilongibacter aquaticus TaxID=2975157 RepID=UPI0021BD7067|nr:sulfatase [Marinilongibacter aquaticus]UBM58703.1 sulfatase [Marinilongibacter aquaticus]
MKFKLLCLGILVLFVSGTRRKKEGSFLLNTSPKSSPNIIFILTDDHGWGHTSHRADTKRADTQSDFYETPNIDKLAARGVLFTQGYAPNPICAPSRNALMFGQNAARHIYAEDSDWYKKTSDWLTIPRVLKMANPEYKTAHFGKWHIGMEPKKAGFDQDDGMHTNDGGEIFADGFMNNGKYKEESDAYLKSHKVANPQNLRIAGKPSLYWSDPNPKDVFGITKRAQEFIRASTEEGKPFYAQLSHFATHLSLSSTKESYAYFKKKAKGDRHKSPEYAAMLKDLDTSIGLLLDYIQELGIANNTYIFLMGDNGGRRSFYQITTLDDQLNMQETHFSLEGDRNLPLRDGKHSFYEGGLRVPFMASGPGIKAGRVCEIPVTGLDLLPSFADLAGYTATFPDEIDGGSLLPILLDENVKKVNRHKEALFFHQASHRPPRSAVRLGDYKLIKYYTKENKFSSSPTLELYDLVNDLGETNDISKQNPEKTRELEKLLNDFITETKTTTEKRKIASGVYRLLDDMGKRQLQED